MLYPYRMFGHHSTHCTPLLKSQQPAHMMGHLGGSCVFSVLPSTHSSFPSPAEKGSRPALPEGNLPPTRGRCSAGGSGMGFQSTFANGCLQVFPPDIPSMQFIPGEKKKKKRLYLQKAPVPAARNQCFGFLWEIEHWSVLY